MSKIGWRRKIGGFFTRPVARMLARTPITPNTITWLGFLLSCGAAFLIAKNFLLFGGIAVLIAGVMDAFDGALARQTGRESPFGAVLDSTIDRLSEGVVLLGIIYMLAGELPEWGLILAGAALILSFTVSYVRARGEGMGIECSEGWFTRVERVIVIAIGLIVNQVIIALIIVASLSLLTAIHRLFIVSKRLKG